MTVPAGACRPLAAMPAAVLRSAAAVLADIDDTVTEGGRLPSGSLAAMERLSAAGLRVVPVTGRPAGWCDHIARMWPVDAVVGENGAFYFAYDRARHVMRQAFARAPDALRRDRRRLERIRARVLAEVPGAGIASDQGYRLADLAIDVCEDVAPLDEAAIARVLAIFAEEGATAKRSSIHVNGWFGRHDKLTMARRCLAEALGLDAEGGDRDRILYVGDSPNDAPMFAYFPHAVGVANVRDYDMPAWPAWITTMRSAAGFAELADAILAARAA